MKGLISNQNGPKLEEILRLLAQNDAPTHITLRGFGHGGTATLTVMDGRLLNVSSGSDSGTEALKALLSQDSWHFETFPELRVSRSDFLGEMDVAMQVLSLRAEMQAERAEAEVESRRSHAFSIVGGVTQGNLNSTDSRRVDEEFTFLSYYAREVGASLGLGGSKTLAYCEADRAMAMRARGDQWEGAFVNRSASVSQILSELG